jgi:hypothetical protein
MIRPNFHGTGDRCRRGYTRLKGVLLSLLISLLGVGVLTGCTSGAISQRAEPGSSVVFLIGGKSGREISVGYAGTSDMQSAGRWDPQRGGLIFEWLDERCPLSPFPPYSPACRLRSRLVSRLNPDPASDAGLQNHLDSTFGWHTGSLSQVVALVDIPRTTLEWDPTRQGDPFPVGGGQKSVRVVRFNWGPDGSVQYQSVLSGHNPIGLEVIEAIGDGGGVETPFYPWSTVMSRVELVPHPKMVFYVTGGLSYRNLPSALHAEFSIPANRVDVLDVFEVGIPGHHSMVTWRLDGEPGDERQRLVVDYVNPVFEAQSDPNRRRDEGVAIVFELRETEDGTLPAPVSTEDFIYLADDSLSYLRSGAERELMLVPAPFIF